LSGIAGGVGAWGAGASAVFSAFFDLDLFVCVILEAGRKDRAIRGFSV
jgi:hypothetical protein